MKTKRIPLYTLIASIVLGAAVIVLAYTAGNPPQCEGGLTPEKDGCIIGANIGGGLLVFLGFAVYIFGALVAFMLYAIQAVRHKTSPWQATVKIVLTAIIGITVSVIATYLLIDNLPPFGS